VHNFKELNVWEKARQLVSDVYKITGKFPKEEKYGLGNQIQRAVISIPSNIAEGAGRGTDKDFMHFLDIAIGSSYEVETQLILANDLDYISQNELKDLLDKVCEIQKMIHGFKRTLGK